MKKPSKNMLFRPFEYIAGTKALVVGLTAILLTGFISFYSNTHFDGVIDVHFGKPVSMLFQIAEGIIDWLCLAGILLVAGNLISDSKFRIVDIFGTLAFARWPMLPVALFGFLFDSERIDKYIKAKLLHQGDEIILDSYELPWFIFLTLLTVLFSVWMIVLMYNAYSISCNVKGKKAVVSFIIGLLLAEVAVILILDYLYN